MKNIKKLEIIYYASEEELIYSEDEKSLKLLNTLEHLNLSNINIRDLSFLSDLHSLKILKLHEMAMKNDTLRCIAENCLDLHTLLLSCKNLSTYLLIF